MYSLVRVVLVTFAIFMLNSPVVAGAENPTQVSRLSINGTDNQPPGALDQELAKKRADFESFAKKKVRQLNSNHRYSRSRMLVVKQADGSYQARFHEIDDSTLGVKVSRSKSKAIPFVGVLSYREQIYESSSKSPDKFDPNTFALVKVIPNRHIFSYKKGHWD